MPFGLPVRCRFFGLGMSLDQAEKRRPRVDGGFDESSRIAPSSGLGVPRRALPAASLALHGSRLDQYADNVDPRTG